MPAFPDTGKTIYLYTYGILEIPTLGGLLLNTLQSSNTGVLNSSTNSFETGKKVAKIFREQKREFKTEMCSRENPVRAYFIHTNSGAGNKANNPKPVKKY